MAVDSEKSALLKAGAQIEVKDLDPKMQDALLHASKNVTKVIQIQAMMRKFLACKEVKERMNQKSKPSARKSSRRQNQSNQNSKSNAQSKNNDSVKKPSAQEGSGAANNNAP